MRQTQRGTKDKIEEKGGGTMAVEAIEGTDNCIKRGCKIAKKNSRVIRKK